jgi:hypothetical protein
MKCPHCGMNIRDNVTECGYCGGTIAQRPDKMPPGSTKSTISGGIVPKGIPPSRKPADEPEMEGDEEEDGGLSRILKPGEQVLIGSLNVSVKKFFFHAYLTGQRIFLIDTQEKKLRVTAKDVPRNTLAGSIVEYSENSDPVLVLSIRSPDDEIKTMKLVFVQNGMDRSAEIDEWIALLSEDNPAKKPPRRAAAAVTPPEPGDEPEFIRPEKPVQKPHELHPAKKPGKDPEKQPPVKRLLSMYNVPEEVTGPTYDPEPEVIIPPPARRNQIRQVPDHVKKPVISPVYDREIPPAREADDPPVRKPEVQSAMKVAMKSALRPLQQQQMPVKRTITVEPEPEQAPASPRRPVVHEPLREKHVHDEEVSTTTPQFCHNCGKKLPNAANFCPGCGTKLSLSRTLPQNRHPATVTDKRATRTDPPAHEHKVSHTDDYDEDEGGETPVPAKPPIKQAPKGSEMTILHKFLRR